MTYQTVSIGYIRDDGDFRILATLNNVDDEYTHAEFAIIVSSVSSCLHRALHDDFGVLPPLDILERQDTPDHITLEDSQCPII